jgi:hypothetical protein
MNFFLATTKEVGSMNVRIWGGWLLVILGIAVLMTMGCEKGALGIKTSVVTGILIDGTKPDVRIAGAEVAMYTNKPTEEPGIPKGQILTARSGPDGTFAFENVRPDSIAIEARKSGYQSFRIPSSTASETGSALMVGNGTTLELGKLPMFPISEPLQTASIAVRLVLRDEKSRDYIQADNDSATISFDGLTLSYTVKEWRDGKAATGEIIHLPSKIGDYNYTVQADPDRYEASMGTLRGNMDIYQDVFVRSRSYNLLLRFTEVPDYITGTIISVFAETIPDAPGSPTKVVATQTLVSLGADLSNSLPQTVTLSQIALPINLRIQVKGYSDEIVKITKDQIAAGTQGTIRVDVNFQYNNQATIFSYNPVNASQAGLFDNRIGRAVILSITGVDMLAADSTESVLNGVKQGPIVVPATKKVEFTYNNVPVGRAVNYTVNFIPIPASLGYASGTFSVAASSTIVPPNTDNPPTPFYINVNAQRPPPTP